MTRYIVGFDALIISFIATIATGWSDLCRVGLTPTERPCLRTAHRNDVVGISRPNSCHTHNRRVRGPDVTGDDCLQRGRNVTSGKHRINALFGAGAMGAFGRDGDVEEGPTGHHRPWANTKFPIGRSDRLCMPKTLSHGKRLWPLATRAQQPIMPVIGI